MNTHHESDQIRILREENKGKLPAFSSIGGYPLYYLSLKGHVLCADCAGDTECDEYLTDPATHVDVHWEGEPICCDACGSEIESAYGVPEGKE